MKDLFVFTIILFLMTSCWRPTAAYRAEYQHLQKYRTFPNIAEESESYLVIFVDAPHLDYTNNKALIQTIAKHPNGCKNRNVGHAWIFLKGEIDGREISIEGGHSGELGEIQPKYFDGIMDYVEHGDPNPIKYLWAVQKDGFFQKGRGAHSPTFAVKVDLTKEQFLHIWEFIQNYNYREYALVDQQCCSFVAQIALLAGISLQYEKTVQIDQCIKIKGETIRLWSDPRYSYFTFGSPDVLEKSLINYYFQICHHFLGGAKTLKFSKRCINHLRLMQLRSIVESL